MIVMCFVDNYGAKVPMRWDRKPASGTNERKNA